MIDLFAMSLTRQTSCVLLPGLRFEGGGDGRSSPALRQSPGLCLSSDRHYKESSCRTEVFKELRVDSRRSVLASGGLVPGPAGTVVRYSHTTAQSKRSSGSSSSPSISKIAEFFTYLFKRNGAALSTVIGYRTMLSAVFKFPFRRSLLLLLTTSFGLLRFLLPGLFSLPHLGYLSSPSFEPLAEASFLD